MALFLCVRCASEVIAENEEWNKDRDCAPCCKACEPAVTEETMQRFSMWPDDYLGGFLWDEGKWWPVKLYPHMIERARKRW